MQSCKIVSDTKKAEKMRMFLSLGISIRKLGMCIRLMLLNFHKQLEFLVGGSWEL